MNLHQNLHRAFTAALACALLAGCASPPPSAQTRTQKRDPAQRAAFMAANPCPATGRRSGACPGFEADHVLAICAQGADAQSNMQWLSVELHQIKTRADAAACRRGTVPSLYD